jgi:hypothetical protein
MRPKRQRLPAFEPAPLFGKKTATENNLRLKEKRNAQTGLKNLR